MSVISDYAAVWIGTLEVTQFSVPITSGTASIIRDGRGGSLMCQRYYCDTPCIQV